VRCNVLENRRSGDPGYFLSRDADSDQESAPVTA
jgi:hypothetical protein